MRYHHRQTNWRVPQIIAAAAVTLIAVLILLAPKDGLQIAAVLTLACGFVVFLGWTAASLTVTVDDTELVLSLGLGFLRRRVPLAEIERIERTDMAGWHGFGVRRDMDLRYITYVVAPGPIIILTLKNGTPIRLSTDDPDGLTAVLKQP